MGTAVIENLCFRLVYFGSSMYMDCCFTSLLLMDTLTAENLFAVGTVRSDSIENAPLEDLKKSDRGSFCSIEENKGNVTLI